MTHKRNNQTAERGGHESAGPSNSSLSGTFDVVYADPPWQYKQGTTTPSRAIESKYETLTLDEIKNLPLTVADSAILFLWATSPLLPEALEVMNAWGFNYKTSAVWDKERLGMGYWFRIQHELLLVGIRGDVRPPASFNRMPSVIRIRRGRHSRKPDAVREFIENAWPGARRIELFAREAWAGWETFGNQVERTLFS